MTRVLVTGGTGTLGRHLVARLTDAGYTPRIMSRQPSALPAQSDLEWAQADLATGEGLSAAIAETDVVVHAASKPFPPYRGPKTVDVGGTRHLMDAVAAADVGHLVYVSIVGIDDIPYHYYQAKLRAEEIVTDAAVESTILRATQFHELGAMVFEGLHWMPVWPLATQVPLQPIAAAEVADRLTELVGDPPGGRAPDIGGPTVTTIGEAAETWKRARGISRPVISVPTVGRTLSRLRRGDLTVPDNTYGSMTFGDWLADGGPPAEPGWADSSG